MVNIPKVFKALKKRGLKTFLSELNTRLHNPVLTNTILAARDISFPFKQFEVVYNFPTLKLSHRELAGLYRFNDVVVHTSSGLIGINYQEDFYTLLNESGMDNYHAHGFNYKHFSNPRKEDHQPFYFDNPVYIFNVRKRKTNYCHFMAEDALRLVTLVEQFEDRLTILHQPGLARYQMQLLELLKRCYDVDYKEVPKGEYFTIGSDVIVMDDVGKRHFHDFDINIKQAHERIVSEGIVGLKQDDIEKKVKPIYKKYSRYPVYMQVEGLKGRLKSTTLAVLMSDTAFQHFFRFQKILIPKMKDNAFEAPQTTFVIRPYSTNIETRPRYIKNWPQLKEAFPELLPVSFENMDLLDQIKTAHNSDILIGIHGAGLTNALFMRPGTVVVELWPRTAYVPSSIQYEQICLAKGVHHLNIPVLSDDRGNVELDVDLLGEVLTQARSRLCAEFSIEKQVTGRGP